MVTLNLPPFDCKIKQVEGKPYIFDSLRRKYVRLSPEEWVRQHIVNLLLTHYAYPKALIRAEGGLILNQTQKRTDVVVFDRQGQPFLVVECKAPHIPLTQAVFDQLARYNHVHKAPYLVVSNGLTHYCCGIDHSTAVVQFLDDFPAFVQRGRLTIALESRTTTQNMSHPELWGLTKVRVLTDLARDSKYHPVRPKQDLLFTKKTADYIINGLPKVCVPTALARDSKDHPVSWSVRTRTREWGLKTYPFLLVCRLYKKNLLSGFGVVVMRKAQKGDSFLLSP